MQGGLKVEEVFLPPHHLEAEDTGERDRQDTPHRPSETRLLHLFRDLIGFGDEAKLEKWIKKVWESGCFPPEMRSEMLDLADQWFEQARIAVSAGSVAKLRPSERGFWQDFLSTSARDDWTALIEVSQKIVDVRRLCLKYEDPATRDDAPAQAKGTRDTKKPDNESQKNEKDIIKDIQGLEKRARRRDSHWQISYNIACFYSLLSGLTDDHGQRDHGDRAFDWLERCLDRPYSGQLVREWIERDPELDPIRSADPERWERWRRRVPRMPVEIRPGDRSPSVLALQRDLNRLRVRKGSWQSLKEDGYFGEATAQAVRQFQIAKSIPVTGKVDYAMLALLEPRAVGVS
jgi:hypothetical protein